MEIMKTNLFDDSSYIQYKNILKYSKDK